MRRPPGREAYPGDVFYLHSRLLERACKLNDDLGAGSLTALPIIEILEGDVSTFVPTNVISITDGQILLKPELFFSGVRPAMDVGASVSRVSAAKTKAMGAVSKTLKGDLSRYHEVQAFAQFGSSDLDTATRNLLNRGEKLTEILKQGQFEPLSLGEEVVALYAVGKLEALPTAAVRRFERELRAFMHENHQDLLDEITSTEQLSDPVRDKVDGAVETFKKSFKA